MKHHALGLATIATLLTAAQLTAQTVIQSVDPPSAAAGASNVLLTVTFSPTTIPPVPPVSVPASSITLGGITGTSPTHLSQYVVTALFDIPAGETPGLKDIAITFPGPPTYTATNAFEVIDGGGPPSASCSATPTTGLAPLSVTFTDTSIGTVDTRSWSFGDGGTSTDAGPTHLYTTPGTYTVTLTVNGTEGSDSVTETDLITVIDGSSLVGTYPIVDTGQVTCYGADAEISAPAPGAAFYGQDAQYTANAPSFTASPDGLTVTDNITGLVWLQTTDRTGNGTIDADDKLLLSELPAYVATLNGSSYGGYNDWRAPTIKELYSLVDFRGTDPSGFTGTDTSVLIPYIDTDYFDFGFGDTGAGERLIDAQYISSTEYIGTTMGGNATVFGFNFADGRIKGYPQTKEMYVLLVRGNTSYGINQFVDNANNTISDYATNLMWAQDDSGSGMNWQQALAWVQTRNSETHLGFGDWRLPNMKELQSILDYTRAPQITGEPAIDPLFSCTPITAEDLTTDYPFYWSGTTHVSRNDTAISGKWGTYACFGTALGYWNNSWTDVHGAGAQRSDPKFDDGTNYSSGHGPQGDAVRIDNFVRLVRTILPGDDSVGDGITDAWRREHFGGTGTTTDADSEATADPDGDGDDNLTEFLALTDPNDPNSRFAADGSGDGSGFTVTFSSSTERVYTLWRSTDLSDGSWESVAGQANIRGNGGPDSLTDSSPPATHCFYRVQVALP